VSESLGEIFNITDARLYLKAIKSESMRNGTPKQVFFNFSFEIISD
jgi:hypothetical protein